MRSTLPTDLVFMLGFRVSHSQLDCKQHHILIVPSALLLLCIASTQCRFLTGFIFEVGSPMRHFQCVRGFPFGFPVGSGSSA